MNERNDLDKEADKAIQYVRSRFKDKAKILIGKRKDGKFILKIKKVQTSDVYSIIISEDTLLGLITTCMIYFEHYGLDLASKMEELIGENHLSYLFPAIEEEI